MAKITINDKSYEVEDGKTIIQVCDEVGVEIPRFCYHKKLNIAGNCRMCLVEVEKSPKPVASCAVQVANGMVIKTDSPKVKAAREGVMEFLLINHPLDCPICDQGGECDLQDQAMAYGKASSRFEQEKRAVEDKDFGPLIKTHMTRCIHCTRCVRFATEVAGAEELGSIGRGEDTEIATYLNQAVSSELSGNMIDLCPVGALTSKPYAFKARSWELKRTYSIDIHDAVGSNIMVDSRGLEVMRILPNYNDEINEEWISDKTRFAYDGLKNQRLDKPYIRKDGRLVPCSWDEALNKIFKAVRSVKPEEVAAIAGDLTDCETMLVMKDILKSIGSSNMDVFSDSVTFDPSKRSSYLFNSTILGIEESDLCLMIGANPRHEATIINAGIKKREREGNYPIYTIGCSDNLNYESRNIGDDVKIIDKLLSGKHEVCKQFNKAKKPMMIVGYGAINGKDGKALLAKLTELAEKYGFVTQDWNGFNILHRSSSVVGALDLGFASSSNSKTYSQIIDAYKRGVLKLLFILGDDNFDPNKLKCDGTSVYIGHHGDKAAGYADIVLPGASYTEKDATYVNLEGRAQRTYKAVQPPGEAKSDSEILLRIAELLGINLPYQTLSQIRDRMAQIAPSFANIDKVIKAKWQKINSKGSIEKTTIEPLGIDYYLSNVICRASVTMANCVKAFTK